MPSSQEPQLPFDTEAMRQVAKAVKRMLKRAKARLLERQQILEQCLQWQLVYHQGVLLQSNLFRIQPGMTELVVSDWEQEGVECVILLDPRTPLQDQLKAIFRKSKKLQKGIPHAKIQLELAEAELLHRSQELADFEKITTQEQFDLFCQRYQIDSTLGPKAVAAAKHKEPAKPYRTYTSVAGLQIWVGKSAKDNDVMTFHHANGLDWWLHARDYPGSHVVVRGTSGKEPDPDSLRDAGELALRFSKSKNRREGEVSLTQVKMLKSVKNVPGKVMLSKSKTIKIRLDDSRWNRLRSV